MVLEQIEVSKSKTNQKDSLWSTMKLVYLSIIMLVIASIWRIVDVFVLGLGDTWLNILPSKLFPLLITVSIFWRFRRKEIDSILGMSRYDIKSHLAMGVIIALSLYLTVEVAATIIYTAILDPSYPLNLNVLYIDTIWYTLLFLFVNSVFEETLFRGLLQNSLKMKISSNRAIILSALMFGIWHAVWPLLDTPKGTLALAEAFGMIVLTALFGGVFGVYYEHFSSGKTLTAPILAHTLLNFLNECIKIGPEPSQQGPDFSFTTPGLLIVSMVMYLVAFIGLLLFVWRFRMEQVKSFWNSFVSKVASLNIMNLHSSKKKSEGEDVLSSDNGGMS